MGELPLSVVLVFSAASYSAALLLFLYERWSKDNKANIDDINEDTAFAPKPANDVVSQLGTGSGTPEIPELCIET